MLLYNCLNVVYIKCKTLCLARDPFFVEVGNKIWELKNGILNIGLRYFVMVPFDPGTKLSGPPIPFTTVLYVHRGCTASFFLALNIHFDCLLVNNVNIHLLLWLSDIFLNTSVWRTDKNKNIQLAMEQLGKPLEQIKTVLKTLFENWTIDFRKSHHQK